MKLCDNPLCECHCDVVEDKELATFGWRWANGYQTSLSKSQVDNFKPWEKYHLCQRCMKAQMMLVQRMIDEKPFRCATCFKETWFPVYCPERGIYVCQECVKAVGHEPPWNEIEFLKLTKARDGVYSPQ